MNILEEANSLTTSTGPRTQDYGGAVYEATRMSNLIKGALNIDITPEQWYLITILMKISRQVNKPKRDNLVDIAGYARVLEIFYAEQGKEGYIDR